MVMRPLGLRPPRLPMLMSGTKPGPIPPLPLPRRRRGGWGAGGERKGWEEINTIVLELVCPCIVRHSSGSVEFTAFGRASRAGAAGIESFEQSVYTDIQFHTLLEQSCTVI